MKKKPLRIILFLFMLSACATYKSNQTVEEESPLKDINKETVDFGPNYDDSLQEPTVLPAGIPFLLVNGGSGIAVGMATYIPPHNLKESINAILAALDTIKVFSNCMSTMLLIKNNKCQQRI